MAIQGSGAISFSDLAEEFGDTAPHSFSEFYRDGGLVPGVNSNVAASGAIRLGTFYNSVNELLQTVTSSASINAQTIFGSDWGTNIPKRLSIPNGVTIGPLTIPTGMGGSLEVDVAGNIYGTGGSANGGAGGHAITSNTSFTLNVLSGGSVRGGGGGGGLGGTGGGGTYTVPAGSWSGFQTQFAGGQWKYGWQASIRADSSGNHPGGSQSRTYVTWNNSLVVGLNTLVDSSVKIFYNRGGYDYERGPFVTNTGDNLYPYTHQVRRRTTSSSANSNGGAGGSGGRGQGYNQTLASGSAGSAGGTNAGTGGTGGSGGNWGAAGATGATGANGNRTNGLAGSGGGAAGKAVQMNAGTVTVNNSGTINGTY